MSIRLEDNDLKALLPAEAYDTAVGNSVFLELVKLIPFIGAAVKVTKAGVDAVKSAKDKNNLSSFLLTLLQICEENKSELELLRGQTDKVWEEINKLSSRYSRLSSELKQVELSSPVTYEYISERINISIQNKLSIDSSTNKNEFHGPIGKVELHESSGAEGGPNQLELIQKGGESIDFADTLCRDVSVNHSGTPTRRINVRFSVLEGSSPLLNICIRSYLVIRIRNNFQKGWGSNWPELRVKKAFLPFLHAKDYWQVSHYIDDPDSKSPFLDMSVMNKARKRGLQINIVVYITANTIVGTKHIPIYVAKSYEWSRESVPYGVFSLRGFDDGGPAIETFLSNTKFNKIIELPEEGQWPLLDLNERMKEYAKHLPNLKALKKIE